MICKKVKSKLLKNKEFKIFNRYQIIKNKIRKIFLNLNHWITLFNLKLI